MAELLKIAFSKDLQKNIFPDNQFYKRSKDDSVFVNFNKVQLPHVGTVPTVKRDRTDKGTATKRQDTASEYALHEYSTDPTWLQYSEELLVNYNKRASILEEHKLQLITEVARGLAIDWSSNTQSVMFRTSGRKTRPTTAGTGERKRLVLADLQKIATEMNKQDIPLAGRYALITPEMMEDLLMIPEVKNSDFNKVKPLVNGSVGSFMGFHFFVRSKVTVYTAGGTLRGYDSTTTADTDNNGAIFWHESFVRRAEGKVKVFLNVDDAELYGSKMSALVRAGGTVARKDGKGVIKLVEEAAGEVVAKSI